MGRKFYQITVIIVSLFIIQGFSHSLLDLWQQKQRLSRAKQDLLALEKQEADLQRQLVYYQSDEYVEKIAREKLMLGKAGEEVIMLPKQDNKQIDQYTNIQMNANEIQKEKLPNWKKWVRLFGF